MGCRSGIVRRAAGRMVNYWSNLPGGTSREIRQSEGVDSRDDRKRTFKEVLAWR